MTPTQGNVSRHYRYLLTGEADILSDIEAEEFQRWLDDDQEGLTPPLCAASLPQKISARRIV